MEAKWKVYRYNKGEVTVGEVGSGSRIAELAEGWPTADTEAHARLIAAAPDLLEALQDLMDDTQWEYEQDCKNLGDSEIAETSARRAFADAAIAKALGEPVNA